MANDNTSTSNNSDATLDDILDRIKEKLDDKKSNKERYQTRNQTVQNDMEQASPTISTTRVETKTTREFSPNSDANRDQKQAEIREHNRKIQDEKDREFNKSKPFEKNEKHSQNNQNQNRNKQNNNNNNNNKEKFSNEKPVEHKTKAEKEIIKKDWEKEQIKSQSDIMETKFSSIDKLLRNKETSNQNIVKTTTTTTTVEKEVFPSKITPPPAFLKPQNKEFLEPQKEVEIKKEYPPIKMRESVENKSFSNGEQTYYQPKNQETIITKKETTTRIIEPETAEVANVKLNIPTRNYNENIETKIESPEIKKESQLHEKVRHIEDKIEHFVKPAEEKFASFIKPIEKKMIKLGEHLVKDKKVIRLEPSMTHSEIKEQKIAEDEPLEFRFNASQSKLDKFAHILSIDVANNCALKYLQPKIEAVIKARIKEIFKPE